MREIQLSFPGNEVKKSNELARAQIKGTGIWELRIIDLVSSVIRKDDPDYKEYLIPAQGACNSGRAGGRDLAQIDEACDNLTQSNVRLPKAVVKGKAAGSGFTYYSLFSKISYDKGYITVEFHPDLRPLFLANKNYTLYSLFESLAISSGHSNKLFQWLKSWSNTEKQKKIFLHELQDILDVSPSLRERYGNFKARVLVPAYNQINSKTSLRYEYHEIKKGRKVEFINFIFDKELREKHLAKLEKEAREKKLAKEKRDTKQQLKLSREALPCFKKYEAAGACPDDQGKKCKFCKSFFWKK